MILFNLLYVLKYEYCIAFLKKVTLMIYLSLPKWFKVHCMDKSIWTHGPILMTVMYLGCVNVPPNPYIVHYIVVMPFM